MSKHEGVGESAKCGFIPIARAINRRTEIIIPATLPLPPCVMSVVEAFGDKSALGAVIIAAGPVETLEPGMLTALSFAQQRKSSFRDCKWRCGEQTIHSTHTHIKSRYKHTQLYDAGTGSVQEAGCMSTVLLAPATEICKKLEKME
jgi:hypothetical protein